MIAGVPYDAEVEYLESTGTQWIETDYIPPLNSKMEMRYKFLNTAREAFCGLGNSNPRYATYKGSRFATTYATSYYYFSTPSDNQWHNWVIDEVSHTSSLDSETISIANSRNAFDTTTYAKGFLIFARLSNDGTVGWKVQGQCSFLKFYDGSTLVRDFIPVRVGSVGYMYDRVTRSLFGNAGTGSFVLGPDVATPVMGLRRYAERSILPAGARWVEYLESTGTQYVDTGIYPNGSTSFSISLQRTDRGLGDQIPIGGRGSSNTEYDISLWTNPDLGSKGIAAHYAGGNGTTVRDSGWVYKQNIIDNFNEVEVTPIDIKVNGTVYYNWVGSANYNSSYRLYLFALNISNTGVDSRVFKGKIALCDIKKGGAVVQRLRPIAIGTTGYMLDLVSGEYLPYGNQGTGDFVIGPDAPPPTI